MDIEKCTISTLCTIIYSLSHIHELHFDSPITQSSICSDQLANQPAHPWDVGINRSIWEAQMVTGELHTVD